MESESGGRSTWLDIAACHPELQPFLRDHDLLGVRATILLWDLLGSAPDPRVLDRASVSRLAAVACFARDLLEPDVRERFEWLTRAEDRHPEHFHRHGALLLTALYPSAV